MSNINTAKLMREVINTLVASGAQNYRYMITREKAVADFNEVIKDMIKDGWFALTSDNPFENMFWDTGLGSSISMQGYCAFTTIAMVDSNTDDFTKSSTTCYTSGVFDTKKIPMHTFMHGDYYSVGRKERNYRSKANVATPVFGHINIDMALLAFPDANGYLKECAFLKPEYSKENQQDESLLHWTIRLSSLPIKKDEANALHFEAVRQEVVNRVKAKGLQFCDKPMQVMVFGMATDTQVFANTPDEENNNRPWIAVDMPAYCMFIRPLPKEDGIQKVFNNPALASNVHHIKFTDTQLKNAAATTMDKTQKAIVSNTIIESMPKVEAQRTQKSKCNTDSSMFTITDLAAVFKGSRYSAIIAALYETALKVNSAEAKQLVKALEAWWANVKPTMKSIPSNSSAHLCNTANITPQLIKTVCGANNWATFNGYLGKYKNPEVFAGKSALDAYITQLFAKGTNTNAQTNTTAKANSKATATAKLTETVKVNNQMETNIDDTDDVDINELLPGGKKPRSSRPGTNTEVQKQATAKETVSSEEQATKANPMSNSIFGARKPVSSEEPVTKANPMSNSIFGTRKPVSSNSEEQATKAKPMSSSIFSATNNVIDDEDYTV